MNEQGLKREVFGDADANPIMTDGALGITAPRRSNPAPPATVRPAYHLHRIHVSSFVPVLVLQEEDVLAVFRPPVLPAPAALVMGDERPSIGAPRRGHPHNQDAFLIGGEVGQPPAIGGRGAAWSCWDIRRAPRAGWGWVTPRAPWPADQSSGWDRGRLREAQFAASTSS